MLTRLLFSVVNGEEIAYTKPVVLTFVLIAVLRLNPNLTSSIKVGENTCINSTTLFAGDEVL